MNAHSWVIATSVSVHLGACVVFYGAKTPLLKSFIPFRLRLVTKHTPKGPQVTSVGRNLFWNVIKHPENKRQKSQECLVFQRIQQSCSKRNDSYSSAKKLPLLFKTNHEGLKLEKLITITHECNYCPKVRWSVLRNEAVSACSYTDDTLVW